MKRESLPLLICVTLCAAAQAAQVQALASSTLQVHILPLTCSLDTVSLGYTTLQQVTPEDCLNPIAQSTIAKLPLPEAFLPSSQMTSLSHFASSAAPNTQSAPVALGSKQPTKRSRESVVEEPLLIRMYPLIAVVFLMISSIMPSGAQPLLLTRMRMVRLKLPWLK